MATIKVWLPGPYWVAAMGGLPGGMTADIWTGGEELPASADEVQFVVLPFGTPPSRLSLLAELPRLRVIQLMSAGAERVLGYVPPGVTLCTARGAHDPAVAEWIMAVILAQVRSLPSFIKEQQAETWAPAAGEPLAGLFRAATYVPFTPPFNVTGQPALSLPLHWNDAGLPIGVQLMGRPYEDELLLELAIRLEEARGVWSGLPD